MQESLAQGANGSVDRWLVAAAVAMAVAASIAIVVAAAATAIAGAFDGSVGQSRNVPLHRRGHCPPLLRILRQRFRLTL